jgi:hypothetical protein
MLSAVVPAIRCNASVTVPIASEGYYTISTPIRHPFSDCFSMGLLLGFAFWPLHHGPEKK